MIRTLAFYLAALFLVATTSTFAQTAAPSAAPAAPVAAPAAAPAAVAKTPAAASTDSMSGKIAYYGSKFNGRKTASGERFSSKAMTMAHKTLAFGTLVKVTNPANKKSVVVRVNDRGPATPDRIGDLTTAAAKKIGITKVGVAEVTMQIVGKKSGKPAMKKDTAKAKRK